MFVIGIVTIPNFGSIGDCNYFRLVYTPVVDG